MGLTIGRKIAVGMLRKALASGALPVISETAPSSITDVAFSLAATVDPKKLDTTVFIHYGLTQSLELTPIEATGSPILGDAEPTAISATLTDLLPYKRYFYRIVATNSKGSTYVNGNVITLEPVELTDGNWVAQYDAEYEKNVIVSGTIRELRDKIFDCALSSECNPQPLFDASAGWNLSTGIAISGGNLEFTNVANLVNCYFSIPSIERVNGVYRLEISNISDRAGTITPISSGQAYIGGVAISNLANGEFAKDICFVTNGYFYLRATGGGSYGVFPDLSLKRILGRHAWSTVTNSFPTKSPLNNYFEFDGSNDRLQTQNMTTVGTVYGFLRRIGTDSDFVMRNDFTGWGEYGSNIVSLGSNVAANTFYNVRVRRLWLRTVTDNAGTIAKLNEWLSRDSYVVPPYGEGITASGFLDDAAMQKDDAMWNDGV